MKTGKGSSEGDAAGITSRRRDLAAQEVDIRVKFENQQIVSAPFVALQDFWRFETVERPRKRLSGIY